LGRVVSWTLDINDPPNAVDATTFMTFPKREWSATVSGLIYEPTVRDWALESFRSCAVCDIILPRKWWQYIVPVEFYYRIDNVKATPSGEDEIAVSGDCQRKEPRCRFVIPGHRAARLALRRSLRS